jgi:Spy/CpxP family protein refolding chaperone
MSKLSISLLRIAGVLALVVSLAGSASAQEEGQEQGEEQGEEQVEEQGEEQVEEQAQGQGRGRGRGQGRAPGFPPGLAEARLIREMPEEIGVSKETLEKLEKLVTEVRAEEEEIHRRTTEARAKVQALLDQPRPSEKELVAAVGAASVVAREGRELKVKTSLRIRAFLTDEQLEKFMEIRSKAMARRRVGGRPNVRR